MTREQRRLHTIALEAAVDAAVRRHKARLPAMEARLEKWKREREQSRRK